MITNVKSISAGLRHTLALLNTNKITGWGDDTYNQIYDALKLVQVTGISAGFNHNLGLLKNGTVTGWGFSDYGQINIPTNTSGIKIDAGYGHSLIILNNGNVTGFGYNNSGQIDIPISIINNATKISAGYRHSLALLNDGSIVAWGDNTFNQTNVPIDIGNNAVDVSAGGNFSLALLNDGRVTGWGDNTLGQITIPSGIGNDATGISAGIYHSLALLNNGRVTGWGYNHTGQINVPENIGNNASGISAGGNFSVVLLKNGTITGWGDNSYGQISFFSEENDQSKFEFNTSLFLLNGIQTTNKRLKPFFDTGIFNYITGQLNRNQYIEKYINLPVSGAAYVNLNGYNILNDISFIPLRGYLGEIYTGLFLGKEPYEYNTGLFGLPKVDTEIAFDKNNYINYKPKTYRQNSIDTYYQQFLPPSGEQHILLLDLNLYGFEEDNIEDCDIELNSVILRTGYFQNIPKNPTILNIEILDQTKPIGIIDNINEYLSQKRILQNFKVDNFINYDSSYYANTSSSINDKYKFIKNKVIIDPPLLSNNKNIALPCLFQYKSINDNLTYNLGEYNFSIFNSNNKYLQNGNYITGTQTGFLYFLEPGIYTTILSGNENDFLYTENSLNGKNQNIHLLSLEVNFITGEKLKEIYIENQDKIWATYEMGPKELISGSGFNNLNNENPLAFNIDFERSLSGTVDSPSLFYKEISGKYSSICIPTITVVKGKAAACSTAFCTICQEAQKRLKANETYIDIPKKYLPPVIFSEYLNFYPSPSVNTYRVAIDENLNTLCCYCKDNCGQDLVGAINFNLSLPPTPNSGDSIYSGVFFLDDLNPLNVKLKYNFNYYSGQIAVNSFYDGDKIIFKQYPFDYEKVITSLYGVRPPVKEYTTEFIYSTKITGYNYFRTKQDLIDNINYKFASSGLYSWKPLKYNKNIQYEYGPLLTGIDGGFDESGNSIINLISLRSGKFGSHDIKLNLESRLQFYNYLVPKIIKLEISDDYINWTGITNSQNLQPINTYIKSPNSSAPTNIPYDSLENVKYTATREIPISSELENKKVEKEENLEDLLNQLSSGNLKSGTGTTMCLRNPTGSGIVCGTGFIDYQVFNFSCDPIPSGLDGGGTGVASGEPETEKKADTQIITEEINRFRIGYYDYLS